jgi:uncharacterized damage-inducible protein DinB
MSVDARRRATNETDIGGTTEQMPSTKKIGPQDGVPSREVILRVVREAYAGPAWHGPSLRHALRGVSAADARRRVVAGRNTIWELVLHLAHGRHIVIQRLGGDVPAKFPRPVARPWWPVPPARTGDAEWRADLALLDEYQARLERAIADAPAARLRAARPRRRHALAHELLGMALHDAYHAGQIRLMAKRR